MEKNIRGRKFGAAVEIKSLNFPQCSFIPGIDEELVVLIWASTPAVL